MKPAIIVFCLLCFLPGVVFAQHIGYQQKFSWEDVKSKSLSENKFIFIDCYATWCGPCKRMDSEVLCDKEITEYLNKHFISLKVQVDSSQNDSEEIRSMYSQYNLFLKQYTPNSLPGYFFFSPGGDIVHIGQGYMNKDQFFKLLNNALDTDSQYYSMKEKFESYQIDFKVMPDFSLQAKSIGDNKLAKEVYDRYSNGYLFSDQTDTKLSKADLTYMQESIEFLTSKNAFFKKCFVMPEYINTIANDTNYSRNIVTNVIYKEDVYSRIKNRKNVSSKEWSDIESSIKDKYNADYAERIIVFSKEYYYKSIKNYAGYTKFLTERIEKYVKGKIASDDWGCFALNNAAYEVFLYSDNKDELSKALDWIKLAMPMAPKFYVSTMDTQIGLLYKMGNVSKAIELQKELITKVSSEDSSEFFGTLKKMEAGKPIWIEKRDAN